MKERFVQLLSIAALIGLWALVARFVSPGVLPTPSEILNHLTRLVATGDFVGPLIESLFRTTIGFVVGFIGGVAYGIAVAKSRWLRRSTSVLFNFLLFAPTLVIIFLSLVMMGPGTLTVALIVGAVVGPNVAVYMRDVMGDIDLDLLAMADSFKVGTWRRVQDIYLPYLIPPMLAAARVGFSMSWKVVMLSEVFGFPGGLGFQIRISYTAYNLPLLLAWLTIFVIALLMVEQLIRSTERAVVRWQP